MNDLVAAFACFMPLVFMLAELGEELEEVKVRENVNDVEGKLCTRFDYVGASQR